MSLALGMMVLGVGVALLATLIVQRDRQRTPRTAAQVKVDALLLGCGVCAMVLGLGAVAIGVL
jgi:NO-binding membrane sensor protein with MHYT domain